MARRWAWVLGWALLIEGLLLWPDPPSMPRPFLGMGADKVVHAALFAGQAALAARALHADGRPLWLAAVGTALFGAVTEVQQHLMPGRSMELGDLLADVAGAVLGLAVFVMLAPRRRELHG